MKFLKVIAWGKLRKKIFCYQMESMFHWLSQSITVPGQLIYKSRFACQHSCKLLMGHETEKRSEGRFSGSHWGSNDSLTCSSIYNAWIDFLVVFKATAFLGYHSVKALSKALCRLIQIKAIFHKIDQPCFECRRQLWRLQGCRSRNNDPSNSKRGWSFFGLYWPSEPLVMDEVHRRVAI